MDNYPGGFKDGILIRGLPLHVTNPGKVFWVSNSTAQLTNQRTGSDGNDGTFNSPFATIDYAIGKCTANRGDVIMVKPGHAETVSAASGITADVAGVAIVGLGSYDSRPTITFDTATTADIVVSAANVSFYNLLLKPNFADIARLISSTAVGTCIINCEVQDTAVNMNVLTPFKSTTTTDNAGDGMQVIGCKWNSPDAASVEFVEINANMDGFVQEDNFVVTAGTAAPLFLCAGTKVMTGLSVRRNFLQNANTANDLAFDNGGATNTGILAHNRVGHADVTTGHVLGLVAGARFFDNLSVSTDALSGFVIPAIDVDS